jgi:IS5 family transposase
MVGKIPKNQQLNLFQTPLKNFINMQHELCILAREIDWESIEKDLSKFYSEIGRPGIAIRKMVGLMLLKRIYNLSDENVVALWTENPYWQYFCGEVNFQVEAPIDPSEFVYFRERMGEEGAERLLKLSVDLFGKEALDDEVLYDTTVQERILLFPPMPNFTKRSLRRSGKSQRKKAYLYDNPINLLLSNL